MKKQIFALAIGTLILSGCDEVPTDNKRTDGFDSSSYMTLQWPQTSNIEGNVVDMDANILRENYMIVLDMSGSMNEDVCSGEFPTKIDAAKHSLKQWIDMVDPEAAVGLTIFNKYGIQTVLQPAPHNKRQFIEVLDSLKASGGTPLSTAIAEGYAQLEHRGKMQNGIGEYRMVVVTDGVHSSGYDPTRNIEWIIQNTPIDMFTIGFCIRQSALNQPGKTHYVEADTPEKLFEGLSAALAETPTFTLTDFK